MRANGDGGVGGRKNFDSGSCGLRFIARSKLRGMQRGEELDCRMNRNKSHRGCRIWTEQLGSMFGRRPARVCCRWRGTGAPARGEMGQGAAGGRGDLRFIASAGRSHGAVRPLAGGAAGGWVARPAEQPRRASGAMALGWGRRSDVWPGERRRRTSGKIRREANRR